MIGDRRIIHAVGRGAAEVKPDIQRRVRVARPEQSEHAGIGRGCDRLGRLNGDDRNQVGIRGLREGFGSEG